jgi:hypothetical protein
MGSVPGVAFLGKAEIPHSPGRVPLRRPERIGHYRSIMQKSAQVWPRLGLKCRLGRGTRLSKKRAVWPMREAFSVPYSFMEYRGKWRPR